jgi:DNA repair exonuclease SbcCD nuclease subunit
MAATLKYIHAADFHLDEPIHGLAELPSHLKSALANAPYLAASRVFDLAIAERVDFVLLAGDLFNMELAGPRSAAFILSQFERLADKDIQVYWCGGSVDQPDRWPSAIELPENVLTFNSSYVEQVEHRRDGEVIATIYASGFDERKRNPADFAADVNDAFAIALAHGELDTSRVAECRIRYWALGGRHKSNKLEQAGTVVAYPGTIQGRSPQEPGPHGCKLCRVDSTGKLRVQNVETDPVRWIPQKLAIAETVNLEELKDALTERALKIASETNDMTVLVHWQLTTSGQFNPAIHTRAWSAELLEWLRDEFGRSDRGVWSVELDVVPPDALPVGWYEEDTILGEYLRAVGRYQSDDSLKLALHDYLPNSVQDDLMAGIGHVVHEQREETLRAAALVGVEYLAVGREPIEPETTHTT